MKKQEELFHEINEMVKELKSKKLQFKVDVQTTEANQADEKPVEEEDGVKWVVDECYVSYCCKYKGKDFCMVTYELIKTAGSRVVTNNMVFLPPLGMRYFDLSKLLPYSVEASGVLLEQIHKLWVMLMEMYQTDQGSVNLSVKPGVLTIED